MRDLLFLPSSLIAMKHRRGRSLILLLAVAFAAASPAFARPESSSAGPAREQTRSDADLTAAAHHKLQQLDGVDTSRVNVTAHGGNVMVTGVVPSVGQANRIVDALNGVRGVTEVASDLAVQPEPRTDQEIAQDVREALERDPITFDASVKVAVENGRVTLRGRAHSWSEKQIAGWIASDARGVRSLQNELQIVGTPVPDDVIRQAVVQRIENDPLVSNGLEVSVREGTVSLRGDVRSVSEKQWAEGDAWTPGVRGVDVSGLSVNPDARGRRELSRSDHDIKDALTTAFLLDPRVAGLNPTIDVRDGVVNLSGPLPNLKAVEVAVQIAENTAGVKGVDNALTVRPAERSDSEIKTELLKALDRSALVDAKDIQIAVNEGRVRLTGTVASNFGKWGAEDLVSRTRGVRKVENALAVRGRPADVAAAAAEFFRYPSMAAVYPWTFGKVPGPKTDAQLLRDTKNELFWSPYTNPEEIEVTVLNGIVTLSGEVDSRQAKYAAESNAYEAGARRVNNLLHVLDAKGGS